MSVAHGNILLIKRKVKTMCDVCNATNSSYCVDPYTLCDEHYFEWAEEKAYNDLNSDEEYFHLV